jgi:predicted nucleotide-binding protein
MPRKPRPSKEPASTQLTVKRKEAEDRLQNLIARGCEIRQRDYRTEQDLEAGRGDGDKWIRYAGEVLKRTFNSEEYARELDCATLGISLIPYGFGYEPSLEQQVATFTEYLDCKIRTLESVLERLSLIPEMEIHSMDSQASQVDWLPTLTKKVFVVHGRDEGAKQSVARFLEKLDLEPIILHDQPNQGRTILEKFVDCSNVAFAVVIFTPDDVGAAAEDKGNLLPRARQNVVFELGFFMGKMGRSRVCVLHMGSVEILSDYQGVLYVPMDKAGAWKTALARELRQAGIKVDLNKVF